MRNICLYVSLIVLGIGLEGCVLAASYQPPFVPVRVEVDSTGNVSLNVSTEFVTPIGIFELTASQTVASLRESMGTRVLVIRVDNKVSVYELVDGQNFQVEVADGDTLYRKVNLEYEADGDIILELESNARVHRNLVPTPEEVSCSGVLPSQLAVGDLAQVNVFQLSARSYPGFSNYKEHVLAKNRIVTIVDGPQCVDQAWWWKVCFSGVVSTGKHLEFCAWMLEADNDTYYLIPFQ